MRFGETHRKARQNNFAASALKIPIAVLGVSMRNPMPRQMGVPTQLRIADNMQDNCNVVSAKAIYDRGCRKQQQSSRRRNSISVEPKAYKNTLAAEQTLRLPLVSRGKSRISPLYKLVLWTVCTLRCMQVSRKTIRMSSLYKLPLQTV
jgi:hypothetical protein